MKQWRFFLGFLLAACPLLGAWGQQFQVAVYGPADGLAEGPVNGLARDSMGFLWAATGAGLARFDGHAFLPVAEGAFSAVALRADGSVLALGPQGLSEYRSLSMAYAQTRLAPPLPPGAEAGLLFEDAQGGVWVAGGAEAWRMAGQAPPQPFRLPEPALWMAAEGTLWALQPNGTLLRYQHGRQAFEPHGGAFPEAARCWAMGPGGACWLAGPSGIWEWRFAAGKAPALRLPLPAHARVSSLLALPQGLLLASDSLGLLLADTASGQWAARPVHDHTFPHSTKPMPFRSARLACIDPAGHIWAISEKGIACLTPKVFGTVEEIPKGHIEALAQTADGTLYAVQGGGIFRMVARDGALAGTHLPVSAAVARSLAAWGDTLWAGTDDGRAIRHPGTAQAAVATVAISAGGALFSMEAAPDGSVWACQAPHPGDFSGIARVMPDLSVRHYGEAQGCGSRVLVARHGQDGRLYFGAAGADHYLYRYVPEADRVEELSLPLPFKHQENFEVHDLHADAQGRVWMATTDGLLCLSQGQVGRVDLGPGLTKAEFRAIDLMPDGTVWAATSTLGLVQYHPERGHALFSEHDGLTTNISNYRCLLIDRARRVWVGTAEGLEASLGPRPSAKPTPPPMLSGIRAGGDYLLPHAGHAYRLTADAYWVAEFLSLAFSAQETYYQTRLLPLANDWSEPSADRELAVPGLPVGQYTLEIRAKHQSGHHWSRPLRLDIAVSLPWYRSWWAWLCYGVGLLALMYGAARAYAWRLRQYSREMERIVRLRTLEIIQQKEEIEAQKEELAMNNEQLIDLNNEKNYYIGVVAHDLKSPLNRIAALIDIIRMEKAALPPALQPYLDMIRQAVADQRRLITDILDLQAIESQRINLTMEPVDLAALGKRLGQEAAVLAGTKQMAVEVVVPEGPLWVLADARYLHQVAENLLSNAVKFSEPGKRVYVEARGGKGRAKLVVRDEGPGISAEDQEKLFRKFQRLTAQPTAGEKSTGLGLSIVKKYAEAMGGRVWCKSALGEGASFIVEFDEAAPPD
jgi:signal transduction histidine kinase/streptogramin lyase